MEPTALAPPKKKMGVLSWVLIGCLGLLVVAGAVFVGGVWFVKNKVENVVQDFEQNPVRTAAELAVRMNPEVELVAVDDGAQTMTIREKATGKVVTVDWSAMSEGRLRFEADGQEVSIDASPTEQGGTLEIEAGDQQMQATFGAGAADGGLDWFPRYPEASDLSVNYTAQGGAGRNDFFTFTTADSVDQVLVFYEEAFEEADFEISKSTFTTNGQAGGTILGWTADQQHTFTLVVGREGETTQVGVNSNRKP